MHDAKDESQVTCTDNGTALDPHASHRHTPDLESEPSGEETAVHAAPDAYSAARIVLSVSSNMSPSLHLQLMGVNNSYVLQPQSTHVMSSRILITSKSKGDEPILTSPDRTGLHVRFRSRVRISTGVGRQRRHSDGLSSNASSISSSPSSSISAPLRTHYTGNNVWGPLGSRVKLAAPPATSFPQYRVEDASGGKGDERARRRRARPPWTYLDGDIGERTHLLAYATRHSYVGSRYVHDWYYHDAERERQWKEQLVDQAFGKWPARLLNRHVSHACSRMVADHSWFFLLRQWWWWHLEPILCCLCEPGEE